MKHKLSKAADKLVGRWRIIEMDEYARSDVDAVEPGYIRFVSGLHGDFAYGSVHGWMDCQAIEKDGLPGFEFTWEGVQGDDQVHGRGWAYLVDEHEIAGHIYIHLGENVAFRARPYDRFARREH
ncbi:hypothetical protein [Glutamicibacter uratoxydans]|uniref:hypothetical protein n=1 Tax=Glutamicibacter uratoxydans TaxID=43667 RepID=UPI003D6E2D10